MRAAVSLFLAALCVGMLTPDQALAWGPGVHMVTGNWLLQNLHVLPAGVAAIIMQHPGRFLHGILSADIFIGKGSKAKEGHSHNWESGFALLDGADSARMRAYAYGYLAHLAADVVAHNVYVPGLFHAAPGKGKTAHIYLEIQADRLLNWDSKDALGLFHGKGSSGALALLRNSLHRGLLPFWLITQIYRGSIALGGSRFWRKSMHILDAVLWQQAPAALLGDMLAISTRAIINLLQEEKNSRILEFDPIGADALARAGTRACGPGIDTILARNMKRLIHGLKIPPEAGRLAVTVPPFLASLPPACIPDGNPHD